MASTRIQVVSPNKWINLPTTTYTSNSNNNNIVINNRANLKIRLRMRILNTLVGLIYR